ncbi:MAG: hypothetical protein AB7L90_05260 [Hyphomicrobiaceae bacterium]
MSSKVDTSRRPALGSAACHARAALLGLAVLLAIALVTALSGPGDAALSGAATVVADQ